MDDLRYAIRAAFRTPLATLVIVGSLALGIGANTAVFSFVDAVQFKPLPFHDEDTLVDVHEWSATELCAGCGVGTSYPAFTDWQAAATSFSALEAYVELRAVVSVGARPERAQRVEGDPERLGAARVSAGLFPLLGIQPVRGRPLTADDDRPGAAPVALISDALWTRRFARAPDVLERTIRLDGVDYAIVGVMPEGFRFPEFADVWTPVGAASAKWARADRSLGVIGRLRDGTSIEQARAEMKTLAGALEQAHPESNARWTADVSTLREDLTSETATASLVLMSAVAFVLLIACANVANLQLVRAADRRREIALRLALGASRARIVRLVVAESLVLAVVGGVFGLLIAFWTARGIVAALGTEAPYWIRFGIDARVVVFAIAVTTATAVLCGLWPALRASRGDPQVVLKDGGTASAGGTRHASNVLAVAQLALSLMLLTGAGLLARTVATTFSFDAGYDTSRVVVGDVPLAGPRYETPGQDAVFAMNVVDRLERLPGVHATVFRHVFFAGFGGTRRTIDVEGLSRVPDGASPTFYAAVTPSYFRTYGVTFAEGRDFNRALDRDVVVLNETMARRLWPSASAAGHRVRFGEGSPWLTVIGVVRDFGGGPLGRDRHPFAYVPFDSLRSLRANASESRRSPGAGLDVSIAARTSGHVTALFSEVRSAVRAADPDQPLESLQTAEQMMADWASPARFIGLLMSALAALALGLAAMGTYGVIAYGVSQRTRELGIRIALGASGRQIGRMVTASALRLAVFALLLGVPGAFATTRMLEGVLFGTSPTDPVVFALAILGLVAVALGASWYPSRRAARVDPVRALRAE